MLLTADELKEEIAETANPTFATAQEEQEDNKSWLSNSPIHKQLKTIRCNRR